MVYCSSLSDVTARLQGGSRGEFCVYGGVCVYAKEWMAIPAVSSGHMAVGWPGSHMVAASSEPRGHALLQDIPGVLKVL